MRKDVGKELCCQFAGFAHFMPCARHNGEFPCGARLTIYREDALNALDPKCQRVVCSLGHSYLLG